MPSRKPPERLLYLDGLRGVAALIVVAYHFASALIPSVMPELTSTPPAWVDSPVEALLNGQFWVFVFFVLSGYVLAEASRKHREHFWRDVAARYLRLALPAAASVVLAWALLSIFPVAASRLNQLTPSAWLDHTLQDPIPSLFAAIRHGLFGVFRNGSSDFNNALWTMRIELIGSLAVYTFFQLCRRHRAALGGLTGVALVLAGAPPGYVAFALGAGLSIAASRGFRLSAGPSLGVFVIGVALGFQAMGYAERHGLCGWPVALRPGEAGGLAYPIGALAVVVGLRGSPVLQRFFACPPVLWLGRLSFPVYLVHVPLLYTAVAAAALIFQPVTPVTLAALGAGFMATTFALATVFEIAVDKPVLALTRRIAGRRASKIRPPSLSTSP